MWREALIVVLLALLAGLLYERSSLVDVVRQNDELWGSVASPAQGNVPWVAAWSKRARGLEKAAWLNENPASKGEADAVVAQMDRFEDFTTACARSSPRWVAHLDQTTPVAFQGLRDDLDCRNVSHITVDAAGWSEAKEKLAVRLLTECGFVALGRLFEPAALSAVRDAFDALRASPQGDLFKYPVQGKGRFEYLLPFAPPFNDSFAFTYSDPRLIGILTRLFLGRFKLELQTIITSAPGSGHQRWHQGWPFLFHPEERLPPFAVVVGIPLVNVSLAMGPTHLCPRKKLRFYQGFRCLEDAFAFPSELGTALIFDYKTLHRGPENNAHHARPMISQVFSKLFFLNQDALTNRAIHGVQMLHQRRYWEQFVLHPDAKGQWRV